MDVQIRTARRDDVDALVALILGGKLAGGDDDGPEFRDAYVAAIDEIEATPGSSVLVAVDERGDVVGMLQLITFRHVQHRGGLCAEIESMHVREDRRGSGVGAQLLDDAVKRASEMGCYRIQLTSNAGRPDAHRFYERHGFVSTHHGFKRLL